MNVPGCSWILLKRHLPSGMLTKSCILSVQVLKYLRVKIKKIIKYVLNPTFTNEEIQILDLNTKVSRAFDGTKYLPGIVGLNNIKENDYANVVFQSLINVSALRDYFISEENYKNIKVQPGDIMINLVKRMGELTRKLWNPRNFKAHVSPHVNHKYKFDKFTFF
jgi:ubiquitin C-terminal hydrolase